VKISLESITLAGDFSFMNSENVPNALVDVATSMFRRYMSCVVSGVVTRICFFRQAIKAVNVTKMMLARKTPQPMATSMISACDWPSIDTLGTGMEEK
jgi:hypothetical protein